jgi:hypothetical protein
MQEIKIAAQGEKIAVTSPYHPAFVKRARDLNGKWNSAEWVFDAKPTPFSIRVSYGFFGDIASRIGVFSMPERPERPWYLRPTQYNDAPEIPGPVRDADDPPIDYSKGPDHAVVFGEDLDDDEPSDVPPPPPPRVWKDLDDDRFEPEEDEDS